MIKVGFARRLDKPEALDVRNTRASLNRMVSGRGQTIVLSSQYDFYNYHTALGVY